MLKTVVVCDNCNAEIPKQLGCREYSCQVLDITSSMLHRASIHDKSSYAHKTYHLCDKCYNNVAKKHLILLKIFGGINEHNCVEKVG